MSVTLTPRDPATTRRPKDTLELRGEWELAQVPETVEARLFWYTKGKGTEDVGIVETQPAPATSRGAQNFRFRLPDGPYSFSGRLITLLWAVELVADTEVARWEFTMSPGGGEIRLEAAAGTAAEATVARR